MDPFSIASNAAGVAQAAWKLYEFINGARNVNNKIRTLQNEIKQVGEVFGLVKDQVKLLPEDSDLLQAIQDQIDACAVPIGKIEKKLKSGKHSNILQKVFLQAKLNLNEDDIRTCQRQIKGSITNLQLCLHLVGLQVTYISTQRVDNILLSTLENIQRTLNVQGQAITEPIRRYAGICLTNGSVLYERSIREGTVIRSGDTQESETVSQWLNHIDELNASETGSDSTSQVAISTSRDGSASPDSFQTARGQTSEDSLNTQVTKASLELGREAFYAKDFDKAEGLLNESLELIRILPKHKQRRYNLEDVKLSLAICAFYTQDLTLAEAGLAALVRTKLGAPENAEVKGEASRCLAITYARMEKFDMATSICENLYKDQVRLFGKDERCYKTVALLTWIHDIQGKSARAESYRSLLPADARDEYYKNVEQLSMEEGFYLGMPKLPVFQAHDADGPHPSMDSIAWAHSNRYVAISKDSRPKKVSLRCAMTGKSFFEWELRVPQNDSFYDYVDVFRLAFDRASQKLAVALLKMRRGSKELLTFIQVYEVQSQKMISSVSFSRNDDGAVSSLLFNRTSTRLLVAFSEHIRQEGREGYDYAIIDVDAGKRLHLGRTKTNGEHVIWTGDYIAFVDTSQVEFLNIGTYRPILGRKDIPKIDDPVIVAGASPSGALTIIRTGGTILHYRTREPQPISIQACPPGHKKLIHASMAFNQHRILLVIVCTSSSDLYLGAPAMNKWVNLRKITLYISPPWFKRIGLSPDAEYAYWVEESENSAGNIIHKWKVEEHLDLKDYTPAVEG